MTLECTKGTQIIEQRRSLRGSLFSVISFSSFTHPPLANSETQPRGHASCDILMYMIRFLRVVIHKAHEKIIARFMNIFRIPLILVLALGIVGTRHKDATAQDGQAPDQDAVAMEEQVSEGLSGLPAEDRELAAAQRFCPLHVYRRLGAAGTPIKIGTTGQPFFVCCQECAVQAAKGGAAIKRIANNLKRSSARLAKLPAEVRAAAEAQKYCPIYTNRFLGSMGAPVKLILDGTPVYVCCPDCIKDAEASPAKTVAQAEKTKQAGLEERGSDGEHREDSESEAEN